MKKINNKFLKLRLINDLISLVINFFIGKKIINSKGKCILIVNLHLLGDAVLDFPLIEAIRSSNKDKKVIYLTGTWNEALFSTIKIDFEVVYLDCPWVKQGNLVKFIGQLHNLKNKFLTNSWSYCIDVRGDFRNILLLRYLQTGGIVTFSWTGGKYLLSISVKDDGIYKHLAEHHVAILNSLGIDYDFNKYIPALTLVSNEVPINDFSALVHFGASLPLRAMPLNIAPNVLASIRKSHENIIFVVDPGQLTSYTDAIEKILSNFGFKYLLWKGELSELIQTIVSVPEIFAMDSGIAHLSTAFGKKVTVFFGPSDKRLVGPLGKNVTYINGQNEFVGPCFTCDHINCKSVEKLKCYKDLESKL